MPPVADSDREQTEVPMQQTRPFPPTPEGRSPAGAEIRYLIGGETGDMIHSTVPADQVNQLLHVGTGKTLYAALVNDAVARSASSRPRQ